MANYGQKCPTVAKSGQKKSQNDWNSPVSACITLRQHHAPHQCAMIPLHRVPCMESNLVPPSSSAFCITANWDTRSGNSPWRMLDSVNGTCRAASTTGAWEKNAMECRTNGFDHLTEWGPVLSTCQLWKGIRSDDLGARAHLLLALCLLHLPDAVAEDDFPLLWSNVCLANKCLICLLKAACKERCATQHSASAHANGQKQPRSRASQNPGDPSIQKYQFWISFCWRNHFIFNNR